MELISNTLNDSVTSNGNIRKRSQLFVLGIISLLCFCELMLLIFSKMKDHHFDMLFKSCNSSKVI